VSAVAAADPAGIASPGFAGTGAVDLSENRVADRAVKRAMGVDEDLDHRSGPPRPRASASTRQSVRRDRFQERGPAGLIQAKGCRTSRMKLTAGIAAGEQKLWKLAISLAPSRHDQPLTPAMLVLQPRIGATTGNVAGIKPLGDDSLQPKLRGTRQKSIGLPSEMPGRSTHPAAIELELAKQLSALAIRQRSHRPTIEVQDIENDQRHRISILPISSCGKRPAAEAVAQRREVRLAAPIKTHQLSVEH
jgi:hypothetical protein